jgi:hypothetical protein
MRTIQLLAACLSFGTLNAQQVDWLIGDPVGYDMNPGMPRHTIASAPEHLVSMRTESVSVIFGSAVFGTVMLEALDPATGDTWLSCLLSDQVSVGTAVVDPAGIAYFAGTFMGDALEFCNGPALPGVGGFFPINYFVMAWNLNTGMPLWARNLTPDFQEIIEMPSLAVDPAGNLWIAAMEFSEAHLLQVDFFGDDVQMRTVTGIRRLGTISFDPWGGLYVSGSCDNGTLTFAGQGFPVESDEGYNMFVLRYKPDGTAGFAEFGTDITFSDPMVIATQDGHAYLAGDLHLSGNIWGDLQFNGPNWGSDLFLAKLDSTGQFLWGVESAPEDLVVTGDLARAMGACLALDAEDRPILMGTLRGSVDWGNGVVSDGQVISDRSLTVVAFDGDGIALWAATSEPSTWFATAQSVAATAELGAVHFISHVASEFTFGGHTVGADMAHTAVIGRIDAITIGITEQPGMVGLHAWPNPAADVLFVEVEATAVLPAELLNSSGQRVRNVSLMPGGNAVNVGGLAPGLYLLRVVDGRAVRVVVE